MVVITNGQRVLLLAAILFVEDVETELVFLVKGRKAKETGESYQLSEPSATYSSHFEVEKADIGVDDSYFWDINLG